MTDLLPCPFCGSEAMLMKGPPGCHWVQCNKCKAATNDVGDPSRLWNTRATPQPTRTVLPGFARARTTDNDAGPFVAAGGGDYDAE